MNKKEAIEKIEKEKSNLNAWEDLTRNHALDVALTIVKELDEPEKPVLSEGEDKWLKGLKITYPMQTDQLYFVSRQGWGHDFEYTRCNTKYTLSYKTYEPKEDTEHAKERLINAILYGYTVKKTKRYIVEIPNNLEGCYNLLVKNHDDKIILGNFDSEVCKNYPNTKLTEAEIKQDFEWTWQFAEEVDE
ncbi:hypothetical protein Si064_00894 [Streptococcus infantarius subsp. infantarius]|uniref:DUF1642 domain-containing protein n=1 Tax=Streptococcus sp. TaxID=1306 RepID=UPI000ECA8F4B|nr:DUF1642 domain-containing protein [Streptococcus sp.]MCO4566557.1 hypothetical protein [Streptococcus infantarius subsp. infantarius]MCO4612245.1 hypothetical protein [Streptococcus infantarius subsp. infantarius]HCT82923.1 hypothetical protein [Streptococcus sp.]